MHNNRNSGKSIGIYIHVPFCRRKCWYCDFYSVQPSGRIVSDYVAAVCREITLYSGTNRRVESIYFGGGTPNLLIVDQFSSLLAAIRESFEVSKDAEVTVEMNPELVTAAMACDLRGIGVNRVSIGAQSFFDQDLNFLSRIGSSRRVLDAIKIINDQGFVNVSIDLILGLPGQSILQFEYTIDMALDLGVSHLSAYLLKVDATAKSNFPSLVGSLPADDDVSDLYEGFVALAANRGFSQYEISNFATKNKVCSHNLRYWRCQEYIGFGPFSHSFFAGVRYHVCCDLVDYLQNMGNISTAHTGINGMLPPHLQAGNFAAAAEPSMYSVDTCDPFFEYVMLGLRLTDGVSIRHLLAIDPSRGERFLANLEKQRHMKDFLVLDADQARLTTKGFLVSNQIISLLLF
jgi:oxygen-independent coproporphyrinogen-3 oxidase